MIRGHDYLGGCQFERAMLRAHPAGWAGGIFGRTFGDARKTVERMAASGRFAIIRVQLAPFDRSHRYEPSKYLKQVYEDAKFYEGIARKYPGKGPLPHIMLSPFCEHNHSARVMRPIFDELKRIAPSCGLVNSIWRGEEVSGICTEIHLENSRPKRKPKGPYMVSFDGFGGDGSGDFTDADVDTIIARYPDALAIFSWNFRFNGKFGHKDKAPVDKRKHWPDENYIRGHTEIMLPRTSVPSWPNNALLKPFADDHGEGGKDNKLMVILPERANEIEILDSSGKVIDKPRRLTPDHSGDPKGARYYSSRYAYQVADIARRNTGTDLVTVRVKVGSKYKHYPATDAGKRSGRFR